MKKALVTGGKGFVGAHLCDSLRSKGYEVEVFDYEDGQDIRNAEVVDKAMQNKDVVFNLAGLLGTHELIEGQTIDAVETNVIGCLNVLNAAKKYGVDVVEIGKPNIWNNTYSITKEAAESFTEMYVKEFGVKAWIVVWYNIYGPGQKFGPGHPQKLAPTSIMHALRGEAIEIYGDGEQTADHIYVKDAADAAIAIYECEEAMGKRVEVGAHHMTINQFVDAVIRESGATSKKVYVPMRRGEVENSIVQADTKLLREVVKFEPKYGFIEGLKLAIEHYRQYV